MKYIKQLDTLRAFAVILVIISHWLPRVGINKLPNGVIGVDIFFVLSGFLISKILFDNRIKSEQTGTAKSYLIKNFYVRRTLRIFPIYYLTIFGLLLFAEGTGTGIRENFGYFATYTSNFYFFKIQAWDGMLSHLWPLAVEEQFYLIWPWVILFANKKYFFHTIIAFIIIGVGSQYLLSNVKMSTVLTFTCFDAFGLGALLAWVTSYKNEYLERFFKIISVVAGVCLVYFIVGAVQNKWTFIPLRTTVSFMTVWMITWILIGRNNNTLKLKFILNNRFLIFLGKISYGMYLYHNILPQKINSLVINKYFNPLLPDLLYKRYWGYLYFVENFILLVLISWLSYVIIEMRFLNLKKYFEYQKDIHPVQKLSA